MLPVDFIESMRQQMGHEAELLLRALETEPVTSIRLNTKLDVLTFDCDTDEVPWHIDGYYLSKRPQFTLDPLFHAGCYYVQEASSMFLQQALEQYLDTSSVVLTFVPRPAENLRLSASSSVRTDCSSVMKWYASASSYSARIYRNGEMGTPSLPITPRRNTENAANMFSIV